MAILDPEVEEEDIPDEQAAIGPPTGGGISAALMALLAQGGDGQTAALPGVPTFAGMPQGSPPIVPGPGDPGFVGPEMPIGPQLPQDSAPPPAARPSLTPLQPSDIPGYQEPSDDNSLPLPPEYAQSIGDLPPELQAQARQSMLSQMGMAFGSARAGTLGSAIAAASGVPSLVDQQAVKGYQQTQDLEYRRALAVAEAQQKQQLQAAAQDRQNRMATQLANGANSVLSTLGPESQWSKLAQQYAESGDATKLGALMAQAPKLKSYRDQGVDIEDMTGDSIKKYEEKAKNDQANQALLAKRAVTDPLDVALAKKKSDVEEARQARDDQLMNSLITRRELLIKSIDQQNKAAAGAMPLTQTELAKVGTQQANQTYGDWMRDQAAQIKAGNTGEYGNPDNPPILPAAELRDAARNIYLKNPILPPGASPARIPSVPGLGGAEARPGGAGLPPGPPVKKPPPVPDAVVKKISAMPDEPTRRIALTKAGFAPDDIERILRAARDNS